MLVIYAHIYAVFVDKLLVISTVPFINNISEENCLYRRALVVCCTWSCFLCSRLHEGFIGFPTPVSVYYLKSTQFLMVFTVITINVVIYARYYSSSLILHVRNRRIKFIKIKMYIDCPKTKASMSKFEIFFLNYGYWNCGDP